MQSRLRLRKLNKGVSIRTAKVQFEHLRTFAFLNSVPLFFIAVPLFLALRREGMSWAVITGIERRWQSLIGGALVIQAAEIGGYFIYQQIKRDDRADQEVQRRRFQAEFAILPMILSDLIDHLNESAEYGYNLFNRIRNETVQDPPDPPARLPETIVQQLKGLVEGGDENLMQAAQTLLRKLQIHGSRLKELSRSHGFPGYSPPSPQEMLNVLADTAELHAIVENLFLFARGKEAHASTDILVDAIHRSSQKTLWNHPDTEGLESNIDHRHR